MVTITWTIKILLPAYMLCVGGCGHTIAIATPDIIIYSFHSHTPILQFTHPIATPNSPLFSQPRLYTIGSDIGDDTGSDTESDTSQYNHTLLQPPHHWKNKRSFYFE